MTSFGRKHLCLPGLLSRLRTQYQRISDLTTGSGKHALLDCLMSGIALFGLKYPSLLKFAEDSSIIKDNLKALYGIDRVPSDTSLRERLDWVDPMQLQRGMNRIIAQLQRGKVLECYRYWHDHLLVAVDGTGYFSSHKVHCDQCCVKNHRDGSKTYYHQMLSAVIVHPDQSTVFPIMLEPIQKQDGAKKNDCEHTALKRLLVNLRKAHPHLKLIVTLDGLYADSVIIGLLKSLDIRFIITANKNDVPYCYDVFHTSSAKQSYSLSNAAGFQQFSWVNQLPLNASHSECKVNLLRFDEVTYYQKKVPQRQRFAWITDLPLNPSTVTTIMKGGRSRWQIENETFNTLKNQGYQFDHNFGHGYQNLSIVMAYLMLTAFLIDQVQAFCCKYFQAALKKQKRLSYLWERMRNYFLSFLITSWDDLYAILISGHQIPLQPLLRSPPDTS